MAFLNGLPRDADGRLDAQAAAPTLFLAGWPLVGEKLAIKAGTGTPARYQNGLPLEANGALAVEAADAESWTSGLPLTANGRLAVEMAVVVNFQAGFGWTARGRLAMAGLGPIIIYNIVNEAGTHNIVDETGTFNITSEG